MKNQFLCIFNDKIKKKKCLILLMKIMIDLKFIKAKNVIFPTKIIYKNSIKNSNKL